MTSSGYAVAVMRSLLEFQKAGYLCDTVIVVDDGQLRAHSAVLAATSPLFKAALNAADNAAEHTVILTGVGSYVANIVLQFIYTGDVVIPDDCLGVEKMTEIFCVLQELGLELPLTNKSYAEVDDESKAPDYDKYSEASDCGSGKMVFENKMDSSKDLGVTDIHLDAVDTTVDHYIATEEFQTEKRRLPRLTNSKKCHKCGHCGRICYSLAVLQKHCSVSHGDQDCLMPLKPPTSTCDKIQLRLSRRGQNRKHPSCWICGRVCSSLRVLKEHFELKHSTEDQSILSNESLLRSRAFLQQSQSGKKHARSFLLCDLCGKACRHLQEFNKHSLSHNEVKQGNQDVIDEGNGTEPQYVCEVCGKVCLRPSALASHRQIHFRARTHSCVDCGKTFTMKKNLLRHQRRHTGDRPLICEHCGRSFLRRASLRDHKSRQHRDKASADTDSLSFHCKRCGEQFCQISRLRRHVVEIHRPAAPKERSLCTLCGKSFSCKFTLMMHIRLHTGERPHKCSRCDRSFPTRAALRHHMFRHTNNYPYVCSTCGKCFTVPSTLANHERIHSGMKPFSCEHCGKLFGQRCRLKQHILMSHVKDKSLQCSKCEASFCRQLDLKRHYLRVHQT